MNNKSARVTQETRDKIRKVAKEMGYVRDSTAISLKKNYMPNIGLIVPDISNEFYGNFAKGAEQFCSENHWGLIINSSDNDTLRENQYIDNLYQQKVAGIIMARASHEKDNAINSFTKLKELGIEHVLLDFSGTDKSNVVTCNHFEAGYNATKLLISLGHRNIACITGDQRLEGDRARLDGYKKALEEAGIKYNPSIIVQSDYTYGNTMKVVQQLDLSSFTAVFAFNDLMAVAFCNYVASLGFNIPNDYSVIGNDNTLITRIGTPTLTTISQPIQEMGYEAAKIIYEKRHNPSSKKIIQRFPTKLVRRNSTLKLQSKS